MNQDEKDILEMLRHYWYRKEYIPDKMMEKALTQLWLGKNPFLQLREHFEKNYYDDISWELSIWSIKLENDL